MMSDEIPVSVFYLLLLAGGFLRLPAATMYHYDVVFFLCIFMYMYGSVIDNSEASLFMLNPLLCRSALQMISAC